jgi:hypothetical protein
MKLPDFQGYGGNMKGVSADFRRSLAAVLSGPCSVGFLSPIIVYYKKRFAGGWNKNKNAGRID